MAYNEEDEQLPPVEDESERPTLGARIAGMAPPPVIAAAPDAPPPMPKPELDMSKMPDAIKMLTGPASIPTPPTGSNNPQLSDLAKKQASLSSPINPVDPTTHKTKPEYRMGIGSRILGAVADFGAGFNGRPAPVYIGPGATNQRFAREESQRQGELEGVNTQIGTQQKMDTENERMYRDAIRQAYESQVGQARLGTSQAQQDTANVKQQLADLKANQGPPEPKTETEIALAYQTALLKGDKSSAAKYKGALDELRQQKAAGREPRQPTELDTWMSAFKRDNGRAPTADEIANRKSRTSSKADQIEKDKDTALQKAETKAQARIDKLKIFDPADPRPVPQRKQAVYDDLEKEKAQIQKEYETRAAQNAGASQPKGKSAGPAAKATSAKIDPKNLPQQVMVGGKVRKVAGYNQQTGKVILAPEGQ